MAKVTCDYCGKELERHIFCSPAHKSNWYHKHSRELEKPKQNLQEVTAVVPSRAPSQCELSKFNGIPCKFSPKFKVKIRGWDDGKEKEGFMCGKHKLALEQGREQGGEYDILSAEPI